MTSKIDHYLAAVLCLSLFAMQSLHAAEVVLPFNTLEEIHTTFPEASRHGGGKGGYELGLEDSSARLSLKTELGKVARGTVFSAETYADALNFITSPVTISFDGASLEYPKKGSGYVGRFGVTGSSAGALSGEDRENPNTGSAIYFEINRRSNTFRLVQVLQGTASTLVEWSNKDLTSLAAGSDSINNIAVQKLDLTLSAKAWQINVTFVSKRNPAMTSNKEASGEFSTPWSAQTWGEHAFIGVESEQQLSQDAADHDASTNLLLGSIAIVPAPSFHKGNMP